MKRLVRVFCVIVCACCFICTSCLFGACKSRKVPPTIPPYLRVDLTESHFALGTEVTVTISVGVPETFISNQTDSEEQSEKALLVLSQNDELEKESENFCILKSIADFKPYVWEIADGTLLYKSTESYVVPQNFFAEDSGRFYCSLYFTSEGEENMPQDTVITSAVHCPILYEKDEDGITLRMVRK